MSIEEDAASPSFWSAIARRRPLRACFTTPDARELSQRMINLLFFFNRKVRDRNIYALTGNH